jgi:hypothetical protein
MTYDELIALLEPLGYPIAAPTEQNVGLPAITIEPVGMTLVDQWPVLFEVAEISARTHLDQGNFGAWEKSREMAYEIIGTFRGTKVQIADPTMPIEANLETSPASIRTVITVTFPGLDICTTEPAPPEPPVNP